MHVKNIFFCFLVIFVTTQAAIIDYKHLSQKEWEKRCDLTPINQLPDDLKMYIFNKIVLDELTMQQFWALLLGVNHRCSINKQSKSIVKPYKKFVCQCVDALYKHVRALYDQRRFFPLRQTLLGMKYLSSLTRPYIQQRINETWPRSYHTQWFSEDPYIVKIPNYELNQYNLQPPTQAIVLHEQERLSKMSSLNINHSKIKQLHRFVNSIPEWDSSQWRMYEYPSVGPKWMLLRPQHIVYAKDNNLKFSAYITRFCSDNFYAIWIPTEPKNKSCEASFLSSVLALDYVILEKVDSLPVIDYRTRELWSASKKHLPNKGRVQYALQKFVVKTRLEHNLNLLGESNFDTRSCSIQ